MAMAGKDRKGFQLGRIRIPGFRLPGSKILFWQLGLGALILASIALAAMLWLSGKSETHAAFADGRRLLIHLDSGAIEGKQVSLEQPANAAAKKTADDAPEPVKPEPEKPEADATGSAADAPTADDEALPQLAPPVEEVNVGSVPPAKVPLAPIKASLSEKSPDGALPVIAPDGTKPWRYYAKPFERKGSLPMIAIIVTGLGEGKAATEGALRLPENVTLSFSPYARQAISWVAAARTAGHEIMIDLPLEPSNYPASDPGPHGLLTGKGVDENEKQLNWLMSRFQGYVGFLTPQNEAFTRNGEALKGLLQLLGSRGLMLALGHEPARSETKQMLENGNTAMVVADALIDEELSPTAIQARLASLEQTARTRGYAIGVAQAFPVTMKQLNAWAAKLQDDGFALVPVTFIAGLRFS